MSAIQTVVKSNAEESLGKMFGEDTMFNYSRILIEMMYTGELPVQYYMENISIENEFEHLDRAIFVLRTGTFANMAINLFLLVITMFIITFICKLKKEFEKAQQLEFTVAEGYRRKLKERKREIMKVEKKSQNHKYGQKFLKALGVLSKK